MWRARSLRERTVSTTLSSPATNPKVINSVGRPYATLAARQVPGRGVILTIVDPTAREVSTPTVPTESIARALESSPVLYRHAGYTVEMTPIDGFIRIRCAYPSGPFVEGTFRGEDLERLILGGDPIA